MKNILFLIILSFSANCFSQDKDLEKFFADIFEYSKLDYANLKELYYSNNKLDEWEIDYLKEALKSDKFNFSIGEEIVETIELTYKEKKYIIEEAEKLISIEPKNYLDTIKGYTCIKNYDPKKHNSIHYFSKPIFLRNKSICIFYSSFTIGASSSGGGWELIKFEDNVWGKRIILTLWIS